MRRPLALLATASLVAGSVLLITPAANAAPINSDSVLLTDATFSLSSTTLRPGDIVTVTLTKQADFLCGFTNSEEAPYVWEEAPSGRYVSVGIRIYDSNDDEMLATAASDYFPYVAGASTLSRSVTISQFEFSDVDPGPFTAYAFCVDGDGDADERVGGTRDVRYTTTTQDVNYIPFSFSPSPAPAGSTTTLTIPGSNVDGVQVFCESNDPGHSVVVFLAPNAEDLWSGDNTTYLPLGHGEGDPGFGSFTPNATNVNVSIPIPVSIPDGTYSVGILCIGPDDGEGSFPEAGNARYFGTLTVGPLAEPEPEPEPEPQPEPKVTPTPTPTPAPAPAPAETLPDTGANDTWGIALLALGLLAGGFLLLTRPRRTPTL